MTAQDRAPRGPARVLVALAGASLRRTLRRSLVRDGYRVDEAASGRETLARARATRPDLLILDLLLADGESLEVCRVLREETGACVLILTVENSEEARSAAREAGADEYVTVPFSMEDLRARIATLIGRAAPVDATAAGVAEPERMASSTRRIGGLLVDPDSRTVRVRGRTVHLAPRELALLELLLANPGRVQTHARIAEAVWDGDVESNTIAVHVRWLREKFSTFDPVPVHITTVHGVGYRLDRTPGTHRRGGSWPGRRGGA